MNIALIAHDQKRSLWRHSVLHTSMFFLSISFCYWPHRTIVSEASDLEVFSLAYGKLGEQQIIARIAHNEMDLVIYFADPDEINDSGLIELLSL